MNWLLVKRASLAIVAVALAVGLYIGRPRDVTLTSISYSMDERVPSEVAFSLGAEVRNAAEAMFDPPPSGSGSHTHSHVVACGEGCSAEGFIDVDGVASRAQALDLLSRAQRAAGAPDVQLDRVATQTIRVWWCPKC